MDSNSIPRSSGNSVHILQGQDCRGNDQGSEFRDPRASLGVEEIVNEEEARRRREQLNRRPSYRMILKDLETVGDKPLKKEMDEPSISAEMLSNDSGQVQQQISSESPDDISSTASNFLSSNNGVAHLINDLPPPNNTGLKNAPSHPPPPLAPTIPLRVGISSTASVCSTPNPVGAQVLHLSSPTQAHLSLGQLNLIAPQQHATISQRIHSTPTVEIPSQPQPQIRAGQTPLLNAVNNLEMLGLKTGAAPESISAAFSQNDWQNNLLQTYNRQQQSAATSHHLLQQQTPPSNSSTSSLTGINCNNNNVSASGGGISGHPQHGVLGTRQGSASLTSLSDNEETNRKRQVRLLKNREAAKECRRKKKEYVKCLENRVAVLENQNKALIEELKTLKELYCRKEKGGEMQ